MDSLHQNIGQRGSKPSLLPAKKARNERSTQSAGTAESHGQNRHNLPRLPKSRRQESIVVVRGNLSGRSSPALVSSPRSSPVMQRFAIRVGFCLGLLTVCDATLQADDPDIPAPQTMSGASNGTARGA